MSQRLNDTITAGAVAPFGLAASGWLDGQLRRQLINELTHEKYGYHLRSLARSVGADTPVNEVTTDGIEAWLGTAVGRDGAPPRPRTFRTKMVPIRAYFAWALDRGLVDADPTTPIKNPRNHKLVPRRVSPDVCAKLLHVADFRATTIIYLGLHLGLRACEISRANIQDWDRHRATLLVHGKGGRERVLPVVDEIAVVLALWVDNLGTRRGPMFPGQQTERISPQWVGQIVTQTARTARVHATCHMLRHTAASDLVARGVPMPVVQQFLGHTSLATTTRYVVALS